jgi:hypothetical protein
LATTDANVIRNHAAFIWLVRASPIPRHQVRLHVSCR